MTTTTTARPVDVEHARAVEALNTARVTAEQADAAHRAAVANLDALEQAIASADPEDGQPGQLGAAADMVRLTELRATSTRRRLDLAEQAERTARAAVVIADARVVTGGDRALLELVDSASVALADLLDHITGRRDLVRRHALAVEAIEGELTSHGQPSLKRTHAAAQTGAYPEVYLRATASEPAVRVAAPSHVAVLKAVLDQALASAGGTDRLSGYSPGVLDSFHGGRVKLDADLSAPALTMGASNPEAARQARIANTQTGP